MWGGGPQAHATLRRQQRVCKPNRRLGLSRRCCHRCSWRTSAQPPRHDRQQSSLRRQREAAQVPLVRASFLDLDLKASIDRGPQLRRLMDQIEPQSHCICRSQYNIFKMAKGIAGNDRVAKTWPVPTNKPVGELTWHHCAAYRLQVILKYTSKEDHFRNRRRRCQSLDIYRIPARYSGSMRREWCPAPACTATNIGRRRPR